MDHDIITTLDDGERVTSTYAEIYHDDSFCKDANESSAASTASTECRIETKSKKHISEHANIDDWESPSDVLLMEKIELKPPFTSKIFRGITHEGILSIGGAILQKECDEFMKHVTKLLHDNDDAWKYVSEYELGVVRRKVNEIYDKIFQQKSEVMKEEIGIFYEANLKELETNVKNEIKGVLIDTHGKIVNDLNEEIKVKLAKEKKHLEAKLRRKYLAAIKKVKHYYEVLLENEFKRNRELLNKKIVERNQVLRSYCKQIEAENVTSSMYVLCLERKKCKIKKFIINNYQDIDLAEKLSKLKEKEEILQDYESRSVKICDLNRDWVEKIQKIVKLFFKFISFSMKLLPEQAAFLMDFEKMVVLQLNEIQKAPEAPSIIVDTENLFYIEEEVMAPPKCDKEPFVIVGDESATPPPVYGSRESLGPEVELPFFRVQRQFVYAKCHKFEEVKALLEKQCKCEKPPKVLFEAPESAQSEEAPPPTPTRPPVKKESPNELLIVDDIERFKDCPSRKCQDWAGHSTFPYLQDYIDFTEENYAKVKLLLENQIKIDEKLPSTDPKHITHQKLQFSETNEPYHTVSTQCSSEEDLSATADVECTCVNESHKYDTGTQDSRKKYSFDEILAKRRTSLIRLLSNKPKLLKMFTDESFDFLL